MKTLTINGNITPETLDDVAKQYEDQQIQSGDKVDVLINSQGGLVDVGFALAKFLTDLQSDGVELRAVANGRVWSSAVLPFLACNERVAVKGASILVHHVSVEFESVPLTADELRDAIENIEGYTDAIADFYEEYGVPDDVVQHLYEGGDLTIVDDNLITQGFISEFVESVQGMANFVRRAIDQLFTTTPKTPVFSYLTNYQQFTNQNQPTMTKSQIEATIDSRLSAFGSDLIGQIRQVMNEAAEPIETEPMNESSKMTPEKLSKLEGVLYETPVKIEGNDEVAALAHPAKDVEKDHFVIPIKADGEVVKLAEGDYEVEIDGEKFVIHSTGEDWYLHAKGGVENEADKPSEEKPTEGEPTNAEPPTVAPDPAKPTDAKPCNSKPSEAPKNRRMSLPAESRAKHLHDLAARFGEMCVGK